MFTTIYNLVFSGAKNKKSSTKNKVKSFKKKNSRTTAMAKKKRQSNTKSFKKKSHAKSFKKKKNLKRRGKNVLNKVSKHGDSSGSSKKTIEKFIYFEMINNNFFYKFLSANSKVKMGLVLNSERKHTRKRRAQYRQRTINMRDKREKLSKSNYRRTCIDYEPHSRDN